MHGVDNMKGKVARIVLIGRPAPLRWLLARVLLRMRSATSRRRNVFPSATLGTRGKMELGSRASEQVRSQAELGNEGKIYEKTSVPWSF